MVEAIFKIAFVLSVLFITFLYIIFVYEKITSEQSVNFLSIFVSYVKEVLSFLVFLITWVFGFFNLESLIPRRKGILTPVFLIPGFMMTKSSMYFLFFLLRNRGFENIFVLNPLPFFGGLEEISENITLRIKEICDILGTKEVVLVGYSMGGMVARYISNKDNEFRVKKCITIAAPHLGTRIAYLIPFGKLPKQVVPKSQIINQLGLENVINIMGDQDELIIPPYEESIFLKNTGHFSILLTPAVADIIEREVKITETTERDSSSVEQIQEI